MQLCALETMYSDWKPKRGRRKRRDRHLTQEQGFIWISERSTRSCFQNPLNWFVITFVFIFPRVHLFNLIQYYWLFQLLIENIAVRHNLLLIFNSIPSKSVIFTFHLSYWMPCVRILVSSSTIESIVVQKHLSQRLICPQIVHSVRDLRMNVYDICCLQTLLKYGRKRFF